jgi:hypothetical protein
LTPLLLTAALLAAPQLKDDRLLPRDRYFAPGRVMWWDLKAATDWRPVRGHTWRNHPRRQLFEIWVGASWWCDDPDCPVCAYSVYEPPADDRLPPPRER